MSKPPLPMPEPPMPIPDPEPPEPLTSPLWLVFGVIFVAALVLGCALTPNVEPQTCEADYYRGVYTLCMMLNAETAKGGSTRLVDCVGFVEAVGEKGWYERESPGFEWPIDQDVSGTSVRR